MSASPDLLKELRIERRAPAPVPPSPRRWPWLLGAAVVVLAALWLAFGREAPVTVRTAQAQAVSAPGAAGGASVLDATGYVTARRQATVSAKITGKVEDVLIEEGQYVEEGQILARLEPIDAEAQQALARAQLASARTQVDQARAQLALAEKTLVRSRDLAGRGLVAQAQLDQAEAERDALAAQLAAAERNVEVAQESMRVAEIGVENTVVRAPFSGVITVKAAQPGEIVSPMSAGGGFTRTGIGTVVDMDSLEVQVDVGEAFIGRVQPEQRVAATLNAYPDWRIPGSVIAIVPTADRSKATVKVRIRLDERDARIVPDMGVRVSFLEAEPADGAAEVPRGVRVPGNAIVGRDGRELVYVVRDERVAERAVQAEPARGGQRVVTSGLAIGERVVVAPPQELSDGARVREDAGDN
ncbi:efflux RND transporter periplasmic adaptor subunit [Coralloluteibacterium thermophilus]|uniref:Efflux RND transporter periplasmic adaptor subunit n=1 Tax=Coralloluteibacterium thermophilum TaxID=2707049 RepID=A0ABV9NHF5_9GAMM